MTPPQVTGRDVYTLDVDVDGNESRFVHATLDGIVARLPALLQDLGSNVSFEQGRKLAARIADVTNGRQFLVTGYALARAGGTTIEVRHFSVIP